MFEPMLVGDPSDAVFFERIMSGRWVFELKWDGWRCITRVKRGVARLYTREGKDITGRHPNVAYEMGNLPDGVYDGELVVLDAEGRPNFGAIQRGTRHAHLVLFDLPEMPGTVEERNQALQNMVPPGGWLIVSPLILDFGTAWQLVTKFGLEGVVAKRVDSAYVPGTRSRDWLKRKQPNWRALQPALPAYEVVA